MKSKPVTTESAPCQKFRSKIEYLQQHSQCLNACFVYATASIKKIEDESLLISNALKVKDDLHQKLNHPISQYNRIFSYSKSKIHEHSIVELYNIFSHYLRELLGEMFKKNPLAIVGKGKSDDHFTFKEIVKFESHEALQNKMINKVFRQLENEKSTSKLLEKILDHTKICLNEEDKGNALMYLEMRHLFMHNKGQVDEEFNKKYSGKLIIKSSEKLPTDFNTVSNAIIAVSKLVFSIDKELIDKDIIATR